MKKTLYGTTALITAGLMAGAAGAAEPIKLGVGGYFNSYMVYADQNQSGSTSEFDLKQNGEWCFTGSTKLDNGITIGVNFQFEIGGVGTTNNGDENYLTVSSDSYGTLIIGDENGGGDLMAVTGPLHGTEVQTLQMVSDTTGSVYDLDEYTIGETDDNSKITYVAPRMFGLQWGASYTPTSGEQADTDANDAAETHNMFETALNYQGTLAGVGIATYIAWGTADTPMSNTADYRNEEFKAWATGVSLSYAGFTVGGGYKNVYSGLASATTSLQGVSYGAGISYANGPYSISGSWVHGGADGTIGDAGAQMTLDGWEVEGTYSLAPGVTFATNVFLHDYSAENDTGGSASTGGPKAGDATVDNSGFGISTGLRLSF